MVTIEEIGLKAYGYFIASSVSTEFSTIKSRACGRTDEEIEKSRQTVDRLHKELFELCEQWDNERGERNVRASESAGQEAVGGSDPPRVCPF